MSECGKASGPQAGGRGQPASRSLRPGFARAAADALTATFSTCSRRRRTTRPSPCTRCPKRRSRSPTASSSRSPCSSSTAACCSGTRPRSTSSAQRRAAGAGRRGMTSAGASSKLWSRGQVRRAARLAQLRGMSDGLSRGDHLWNRRRSLPAATAHQVVSPLARHPAHRREHGASREPCLICLTADAQALLSAMHARRTTC